MDKNLRLKVIIFVIPHLLVMFLFPSGDALAFVINQVNGNNADWTYRPSPMGENYLVVENCADCTGVATAVQKAAATWSNAGAKFTFTYGGTTTSSIAPNFDGVNCISWSSTYQSFLDEPAILAETHWWYDPETGDIWESDCVFNDNKVWSTAASTPAGQFDVETVMLHEFGHYLSLGHSTAPAVMQPTVPSGVQRRTLTADDIAGIIAIYGASGPTLTLNQALDNASLAFFPGGNANWFPETATYYYGGSAARSGEIEGGQSSLLQTTVQGPGTVSFYWKVSSRTSHDFLEFRIDGNLQPGRISGNVDWQQKILAIPAGGHTLSWVYVKDSNFYAGLDCGWLDKVVYTAAAGNIVSILPLLLLD